MADTSAPEPVSGPTPPDGALDRLVEVMDRLYSPGGCPWDAEQTHESLVQYLLEEAHELAEAIEVGNRAEMREELGDLLLQVVFHARIAADDPQDPFTVDDVASDLVAKLVRRHPHVFAAPDGSLAPATDLHARWDAIKKVEKQRSSVLEGIPHAQGALARAQKVVSRAGRAGLGDVVARAGATSGTTGGGAEPTAQDRLGLDLLALVHRAQEEGVDAETALRRTLRTVEDGIRAAERPAPVV
ncbi:MazG family protein [Oerskovia flava]|uniref:MazG family protein n=1 Tax=Oerskovia flava TaxID=2986422 RepID=UPI002240DF53|nr:MazG family protein [Oerskovia sp. JB1-3-2]